MRTIVETFLNQTHPIISSAPLEHAALEVDELANVDEVRRVFVNKALHGLRLDKALVECAPEFSRSYLQQLLSDGLVVLNGARGCKPAAKVKVGDAVEICLQPTAQSQAFKPEPIEIEAVYEDADVLVVNKPAGLVVHPAPGHWSGTLLNGLLARDAAFMQVPRAGIVHRLDKDTSGLMVVARHREAMDRLVEAIAAREVHRQYVAIAHKAWTGPGVRTVQAPIGRDPRNRLRMSVVDLATHAGKTAKTDVHWIANSGDGCLVRCVLHTGRTHQIRVHMASLGHPLLGDVVYGGTSDAGITRQALHAVKLTFKHPMHGRWLACSAALPSDMGIVLDAWGVGYNDFSHTHGTFAAQSE